ncbi:MAG: polyprenyl synthetase family protein [Chloroflexales bacterium]
MAAPTAMIQPPLPPNLGADMQEVERIISERTRSRATVISAADPHLLRPGDTRLRSALVLLAAQLGDYRLDQAIHAAAAIELIYAATSTHDDLVDEVERRRGLARQGDWNNGILLMVGDYLFALAAGEMSLSPDPRVISYYSQAVMQICESQLAPVLALRPADQAAEQYFAYIEGTSAALHAAACKAGAACGRLGAEQIEALGHFGCELGMALRIGTELRDFARGSANGATLAGSSLRYGAATLPLILAAAAGDGARLELALESGGADLDWAVGEVRRHGVGPARAELALRTAAARAALELFPAGPARAALEQIADYVGRA